MVSWNMAPVSNRMTMIFPKTKQARFFQFHDYFNYIAYILEGPLPIPGGTAFLAQKNMWGGL